MSSRDPMDDLERGKRLVDAANFKAARGGYRGHTPLGPAPQGEPGYAISWGDLLYQVNAQAALATWDKAHQQHLLDCGVLEEYPVGQSDNLVEEVVPWYRRHAVPCLSLAGFLAGLLFVVAVAIHFWLEVVAFLVWYFVLLFMLAWQTSQANRRHP